MKKKIKVLDIGGRYGIHPTWKYCENIVNYYIIEADPNECLRLKKKYSKKKNVKIYNYFISNSGNSYETLNIYRNKAMSSKFERYKNSPIYLGPRKKESSIIKSIKVKNITLDEFIKIQKIDFDFLKCDIEGGERSLFLSSEKTLTNFIGIRTEVNFSKIFKNENENFSFINSFMTSHGFNLLNLDYSGSGDLFHNLALKPKYGMLKSTDAVYIKNIDHILHKSNFDKIFKLIIFLLLNNSEDVAFYLIDKTKKKFKNKYQSKKSILIKEMKKMIVKFMYKLKWQPGQNIYFHKKYYEKIFNDKYPLMTEYNEKEEYNPI